MEQLCHRRLFASLDIVDKKFCEQGITVKIPLNIIEEYREQTISRRRPKEEFLQKEQEVQNFLVTSIMQDLETSYQPKKFIKALQR